MTPCSLKISKTFKTHCFQQCWLNLKKSLAPLMENEKKKNPIVADDNIFTINYNS